MVPRRRSDCIGPTVFAAVDMARHDG